MPHLLPAAASAIAAAAPAAAAGAAKASIMTTLKSVAFNALTNLAISAALSVFSPTVGASARTVEFVIDPDGPIPFAAGYVGVPGAMAHKDTFGPDLMYYGIPVILSGAGPITAIQSVKADDYPMAFDANGGATTEPYRQEFFFRSVLGHQPAPAALTTPNGFKNNAKLPGWTAAHKLSGKAAFLMVMAENSKGSAFPNGEVKPLVELLGLKGWDPTQDSTYPGGNGPCRLHDASTWVTLTCPILWGLKWALGLWEGPTLKGAPAHDSTTDHQVGGIGARLSGVDVPAFVAASNIAKANAWTVSAYPNTDDDKHQVLETFLQAGGAIYSQRAGKISCISRAAPRASLVTISAADTAGPLEIDTAASRIDRINTLRPRFWSPAHRWQMTAMDGEITAASYRAEDGGRTRSRGVDFPFVSNAKQAGQLAALQIANTREGIAGVIPLKPHLQRIRPGDAFTITEAGFVLNGLKCLCLNTDYDPATGVVRVSFVSETDAKYPFALGQNPTPPTPQVLTPVDPRFVSPPEAGDWTVTPRPPAPGGGQLPGFDLSGIVSNATATAIIVEYGPSAVGPWKQAYQGPPTVTNIPLDGLQPGTDYFVAIQYQRNQNYSDREVFGPYTAPRLISDDTNNIGGRPTPVVVQQLDDILIDVDALTVDVGEALDEASEAKVLAASNVGARYINKKPGFTGAWASGQIPTDWNDWLDGTGNTRVAGLITDSAVRFVVPANSDRGLQSRFAFGGFKFRPTVGWWVADYTVTLEAGSLEGAGGLIQVLNAVGDAEVGPSLVVDFFTEFGAGTVGKTYTVSKLLNVTSPDAAEFALYAMAAWGGFGRNRPAKTITFHFAGARPADAGEVESGVARGAYANLASRLTDQNNALVTATSALATRQSVTEARFGSVPNLVPNSTGAVDTTYWNTWSQPGWVRAYDALQGTYFITFNSGDSFFVSDSIAINGSQSYTVSFNSECGVACGQYLQYYDAAGAMISDGNAFHAFAGSWDVRRKGPTFTTPANCRFVRIVFQKTSGAAYLGIKRIMLNGGAALDWTDDAGARDIAGRVKTSEGVLASISGKVQAWWQKVIQAGDGTAFIQATATDANGNATSEVAFGARKIGMFTQIGNGWVEVLKLIGTSAHFAGKVFIGGLQEITLDPDLPGIVWKIGSANLVIGRLPNQNLVFWFGPAMATSAMTKANATFWLDSLGNAYFGGTLSAGTLTNKAATSSLSMAASVETSRFGSNGGPITVSYSINGGWGRAYYSPTSLPNQSESGSVSVQLDRAVNGAAYVNNVSSVTAPFTVARTNQGNEPGLGWLIFEEGQYSGSVTYTDPQQIAQDRQFRLRISAFSASFAGSPTQQTLSIIAVEQ